MSDHDNYAPQFTDDSFWKKVKAVLHKIGKPIIYNILCLYYAYPEAPLKAKAIIAGALGYFISPIDVVPDVILPAGLADDAAVIAAAVAAVALCITPEVKAKADAKMIEWFGEQSDVA